MPDVSGHDLDSDVLACIELCSDCHRACLQTTMHCLQMGAEHAEPEHLRLMLDCAQICQTSADFMLRGSDLHGHICAACAVVCEHCADSCDELADEDPRMAACAEECRRCAESCRRMSGEGAGAGKRNVRRTERGMSSRSTEVKTWKPTAPTPAAPIASKAKRSRSSSRRASSRSS